MKWEKPNISKISRYPSHILFVQRIARKNISNATNCKKTSHQDPAHAFLPSSRDQALRKAQSFSVKEIFVEYYICLGILSTLQTRAHAVLIMEIVKCSANRWRCPCFVDQSGFEIFKMLRLVLQQVNRKYCTLKLLSV